MVPASLAPSSWSVGMMRAIAASMVRRWNSSKNRASVSFIVFATITSPDYHSRHRSALHVVHSVAKYEPANGRVNPIRPRLAVLSSVVVVVRIAQRQRWVENLFQKPRLSQVRPRLQSRDLSQRRARLGSRSPRGGLTGSSRLLFFQRVPRLARRGLG